MAEPKVQDPDYAGRIARSFAKQGIMETIGATLLRVDPGEVEIALPGEWHEQPMAFDPHRGPHPD